MALHSIKMQGSSDTSLTKGWYVADNGYSANPPMTREVTVTVPYMNGEYDFYSFKNPGKPLGTIEYTFFKDFSSYDDARSGAVEFMNWLDTFHDSTLVDSMDGTFTHCTLTGVSADFSSCRLIPSVTASFKAMWGGE